MFELAIIGDFASAHQLHGYEGNCKELHGHTWKVEAVIEGDQLDSVGMLIDFKAAKMKLKNLLADLDHVFLNNLPAFQRNNPTTEHLAKYIFEEFSKACHPLKVKRVQVWESEAASVTYFL